MSVNLEDYVASIRDFPIKGILFRDVTPIMASPEAYQEAIDLIRDTIDRIARYEGEIPGAKAEECGNYLEHDLEGAKAEARAYAEVIRDWTPENLAYEP